MTGRPTDSPSTVHVVLPVEFDDERRPSGGNVYDRRVVTGLAAAGWNVQVARAAHDGHTADAAGDLSTALAAIPDGQLGLVDGLLASPAAGALVPHVGRLRVVILLHMPLAPDCSVLVAASEHAALTAAHAVVVTSGWTRDEIVRRHGLPPDRVWIARPGALPEPLAEHAVSGTAPGTRLLYVGPASAHKGCDVLASALASLADLDWQCSWVGDLQHDPHLVRRIRERIAMAGTADRVEWCGVLTGSRLGRRLHAADLLIAPSRTETYGMVVTEALAAGVPVIASDVGGLPEAMGVDASGRRPGALVPAGDVVALAETLRAWLTDGALRGEWRSAAVGRREVLPGWDETVAVVGAALNAVGRSRPG